MTRLDLMVTFFAIYLNLHIIATILTRAWKPRLNDCIYAVLAALLFSFSTAFLLLGTSHLFVDVVAMLLLFFYLYKLKSYTVKKSITLTLIAMILASMAEVIAGVISGIIAYSLLAIHGTLQRYLMILLLFIVSAGFTALFVVITKRARKSINRSTRMLTGLLCGLILIVISMQLNLLLTVPDEGWESAYPSLPILNAILSVIYGIVVLASFLLYAKSLKTKYEVKQKEAAQEALQYYVSEIERQHAATRKFEHDWQNIILSFDRFIEESDFEGLKDYYISSVRKASNSIVQNQFVLERLGKIKANELKSILAAKLMTAQQLGIDANFEVNTEIDHIPIDSMTLIRMIGIIMDNAIEALEALGTGKLLVGCFKNGADLTFIVQNSCSPDTPGLRELKAPGFSTKGNNRGLGLSNLSELADSHPNIVLETSIAEDNFIQKLTIGGSA